MYFVLISVKTYLFPICRLPLCPIDSGICLTKAFQLYVVHLSMADLRAWFIGVLFKKFCPMPMHSSYFPLSLRATVFAFMLLSLIHLDFSFVHGHKYESISSICILLQAERKLEEHHLLKKLFLFSTLWFWLLCQGSSVHRFVGQLLGLQSYSINLPACLCTSNMWSLSILLCNRGWH